MEKHLKFLIIILCLFYLTACLQVNASENKNISISFNGITYNFIKAPKIVNGRLLVPAAELVNKMGATIDWNPDTASVLIYSNTHENKLIFLKIGQKAAIVNGIEFELDTAPVIFNNSTFIPLSFVSEGLGAKVEWTSKTKTVNITYQVPIQETPPILNPPWELQTTSGSSIIIK